MNNTLEIESTLTDRYQTTVPEPVRRLLHLGKRDKLRYQILSDGTVVLSRAETADAGDPALLGFLSFLENDIKARPQAIRALDGARLAGAQALIGDVEVDLDEMLLPENE